MTDNNENSPNREPPTMRRQVTPEPLDFTDIISRTIRSLNSPLEPEQLSRIYPDIIPSGPFRAVPWDPYNEPETSTTNETSTSTSTETNTGTNNETGTSTANETSTSTETSTTPTIHALPNPGENPVFDIMWNIIMSRRPPDFTFDFSAGNNNESDEEEIEEFIDLNEAASGGESDESDEVRETDNNNSHECPICMETREKYYTLIPCGHVLCASCVHKIKKKKKKNKCFICRRKAKKKFRIYL